MKKFYAMIAAALMSVSLFAANPTQADLASYAKDGYYVACFSTPAATTCNDIVWIGTYDGWNADDPDKIKCEELSSFPGWYVAVVPVGTATDPEGECSGKPVQLNECGKFSWDYQCGKFGTIELVAGEVSIESGNNGTETDLKNWSKTEATIIDMSEWKNSPCENVCNEHAYTIRLYDPYCEAHSDFTPYLRGTFNNWGVAVPMELKDEIVGGEEVSVWVYTTEPQSGVLKFKWNNSSDKDNWDNQFMKYIPEDEENDVPAKWVAYVDGDIVWTELANFPEATVIDEYTVEFDLSDNTKYMYGKCNEEPEDPADTVDHKVFVKLQAPEGTPAAGPEIIGSFNNWLNEPAGPQVILELAEDAILGNHYAGVIAAAKGKDEFKIREANNWSNEIKMIVSEEQQNFQPKFKTLWVDANGLIDGAAEGDKALFLNLTSGFAWSAPQGIEDIVLTEKAQKVMVDGVLYIIRDNKMFNVQGAQVR